jgi:hypothetical protein
VKGLREKGPLRLAIEGALGGAFLVAVVTPGDISAAWKAGIGIGLICGLIGPVYRGVRGPRAQN